MVVGDDRDLPGLCVTGGFCRGSCLPIVLSMNSTSLCDRVLACGEGVLGELVSPFGFTVFLIHSGISVASTSSNHGGNGVVVGAGFFLVRIVNFHHQGVLLPFSLPMPRSRLVSEDDSFDGR